MTYPPCPVEQEAGVRHCHFQSLGAATTCMYSPIEYDSSGQPVGGGLNVRTSGIVCNACGTTWTEARTELQIAQRVLPTWRIQE